MLVRAATPHSARALVNYIKRKEQADRKEGPASAPSGAPPGSLMRGNSEQPMNEAALAAAVGLESKVDDEFHKL